MIYCGSSSTGIPREELLSLVTRCGERAPQRCIISRFCHRHGKCCCVIWIRSCLPPETRRHRRNFVQGRLPKIYSHELINLIFKLPYCRISDVIEAGIAKRQTASSYLKQLVEAGVLAEVDSGKEKLFVHPKLYDLLTTENNVFKLYGGSEDKFSTERS